MQFSYWERRTFLENTDVLVVGAGIVGLSTAIHLRRFRPEWKIVVMDRHPISGGASSRNAGFACFGSVGELLDDMKSRSRESVLELAAERYKGLQYLRELTGDAKIAYEPCGGFELFLPDQKDWYSECHDAMHTFNELLRSEIGEEIYSSHTPSALQGIHAGIVNNFEGALDTGLLMLTLRQLAHETGVILLNGAEILSYQWIGESVQVETDCGDFNTCRLALCTNGFARELTSELEVRPARNQVLVTSEIPDLKLRGTFHLDRGYGYFRNIGTRVLIGGFRNIDLQQEYTSEEGINPVIRERIAEVMNNHIACGKLWKTDYEWSGILGLGEEKKPIVRQLNEGIYCGVRLGGMGVAIGAMTGRKLAQMISS